MFDRETRKWFWLGVAITGVIALAFVAINRAPVGRAQSADESTAPVDQAAPVNQAAPVDQAAPEEVAAPEQYSSPLVIPAADFTSDGNFPDDIRFEPGSGTLRGTLNDSACVQAPAYLPNGSTVTSLRGAVIDDDSLNRIQLRLHRANKNSGSTTLMAEASSTNSFDDNDPLELVDDSISSASVDTITYSYYVSTCLPSASIKLIAVRLFYNP